MIGWHALVLKVYNDMHDGNILRHMTHEPRVHNLRLAGIVPEC